MADVADHPNNDVLLDKSINTYAFSHFYDRSSIPFFQNLWFPPTPDSLDSNSRSFRGYSHSDVCYSIYKKDKEDIVDLDSVHNYYEILRSSVPDVPESTESTDLIQKCVGLKQDLPPGHIMRSKKIRIFPDADYIKHFNKCFGASRYLYNKTIATFKDMISEIEQEYVEDAITHGCIKVTTQQVKNNKPAKKMVKQQNQGSKTVKKITKQPIKKISKRCGLRLAGLYFCEKHSKCKIKYDIPLGFRHWRSLMVKDKSNISDDEKWLLDVHFDTRQLAIKNVIGGIKSAFTNYKKGNTKEFEMKFKSRKNGRDRFYIDHRTLKPNFVLFAKKFQKPLKISKRDVKWLSNHLQTDKISDMVISREKPGMYFLQVPYETTLSRGIQRDSAVAIDPGVITQGTFYDPTGICGKLGDGLGKRIGDIFPKMDYVKSKIAKEINKLNEIKKTENFTTTEEKIRKKVKHKEKRKKARIKKLKSQIEDEEQKQQLLMTDDLSSTKRKKMTKRSKDRVVRLEDTLIKLEDKPIKISNVYYNLKESRKRIKRLKKTERTILKKKQNITKESHQKIISHYVCNYKYIIIPEFNARGVARKQKAQGMKKEARKTMGMCHGKFLERLKTKVESVEDCNLIIVKEDYTSQTCGRCGILHKVKRSREFNCPNCGVYQDRDTNAARNIFVRGLLQR